MSGTCGRWAYRGSPVWLYSFAGSIAGGGVLSSPLRAAAAGQVFLSPQISSKMIAPMLGREKPVGIAALVASDRGRDGLAGLRSQRLQRRDPGGGAHRGEAREHGDRDARQQRQQHRPGEQDAPETT